MRDQPGVTLLWALRSPCNLQCQYCYFGTQEVPAPPHVGALSHRGHRDLALNALLAFIQTCSSTMVRRVFLAGGEPLVWLGSRRVEPHPFLWTLHLGGLISITRIW